MKKVNVYVKKIKKKISESETYMVIRIIKVDYLKNAWQK